MDRLDPVLGPEADPGGPFLRAVALVGQQIRGVRLGQILADALEDQAAVHIVESAELIADVPDEVKVDVVPVLRASVLPGLVQLQGIGVAVRPEDRGGISVLPKAVDPDLTDDALPAPGEGHRFDVLRDAHPDPVAGGQNILLRKVLRDPDLSVSPPAGLDDDRLLLRRMELPERVFRAGPHHGEADVVAVDRVEGQNAVFPARQVLVFLRDLAQFQDRHVKPFAGIRLIVCDHGDGALVRIPGLGEDRLAAVPGLPVQGLRLVDQQADRRDPVFGPEADAGRPLVVPVSLVRQETGGVSFGQVVADALENQAAVHVVVDEEVVIAAHREVKIEGVPVLGTAVVPGLVQLQGVGAVRPVDRQAFAVFAQVGDPDLADRAVPVPGEGHGLRVQRQAQPGAARQCEHVLLRNALRQDEVSVPPADLDDERLLLGAPEAVDQIILPGPEDPEPDVADRGRGEAQKIVFKAEALADRLAVFDHRTVVPVSVGRLKARGDADAAVLGIPGVGKGDLTFVPGLPVQGFRLVQQQLYRQEPAGLRVPEADAGVLVLSVQPAVRRGLRLVFADRAEYGASVDVVFHDAQRLPPVVFKLKLHVVEGLLLIVVPVLIQRQRKAAALRKRLLDPAALPVRGANGAQDIRAVPGEGCLLRVQRQTQTHPVLRPEDVLSLRGVGLHGTGAPPARLHEDRLLVGASEGLEGILLPRPADLDVDPIGGHREAQSLGLVVVNEAGLDGLAHDDDKAAPEFLARVPGQADADRAVLRLPGIPEGKAALSVPGVPVDGLGLIEEQAEPAAHGDVGHHVVKQIILLFRLRRVRSGAPEHAAAAVVVVRDQNAGFFGEGRSREQGQQHGRRQKKGKQSRPVFSHIDFLPGF